MDVGEIGGILTEQIVEAVIHDKVVGSTSGNPLRFANTRRASYSGTRRTFRS
jgi:hypothetical protein